MSYFEKRPTNTTELISRILRLLGRREMTVRELGAALYANHTDIQIALRDLESQGMVAREQLRERSGAAKRCMFVWRRAL